MNLKNNLKGLIDVVFVAVTIGGSIYAYDAYKTSHQKVYVVDAQKIYQLKQAMLQVSSATEDDVIKHYDSLEKIIIFSNDYINTVSQEKETLVYPKTHILTTKSNKIIDLTDDLINRLKQQKLLP
ncbi:MAG: hypothetical protein WC279_00560 [Sulfurimonas sp.]|jgi:hypothetical protein|uniref:hypothetical protein n=1 Tax=Sulfurimonas sp. TaxID=2022749 RepID=UPI003563CAD7